MELVHDLVCCVLLQFAFAASSTRTPYNPDLKRMQQARMFHARAPAEVVVKIFPAGRPGIVNQSVAKAVFASC